MSIYKQNVVHFEVQIFEWMLHIVTLAHQSVNLFYSFIYNGFLYTVINLLYAAACSVQESLN